MPFKSEKQRKYLWANEPKVAREWTDRYGAANGGIMDIASDGNTRHDFKNFNKGTSVNVPTSFQARSHSTPVNLAYITDDEAGILKALKPGTPHEGPMGIPNYDSFDADGNYTSGSAMSAMETGSKNAKDRKEIQASTTYGGPPGMAPGAKTKAEQDIRSSVINAGAGQRVNPGFFDSKTRLSPYELQLAKEFRNDPNNRFAKKAYRNTGQGGIMGFLRSGGLLGNLIRGLGQRFGLGKKWDESTYDMSEFNNLGLYEPSINPAYNDLGNEVALSTEVDDVDGIVDIEKVKQLIENAKNQEYLEDQTNFTIQGISSIDTIANEYTPGNFKGSEEEGWSWSDFLKTLPRM